MEVKEIQTLARVWNCKQVVDSRSNSDPSNSKSPMFVRSEIITVAQVMSRPKPGQGGAYSEGISAPDLCREESRGLSVRPELGANWAETLRSPTRLDHPPRALTWVVLWAQRQWWKVAAPKRETDQEEHSSIQFYKWKLLDRSAFFQETDESYAFNRPGIMGSNPLI